MADTVLAKGVSAAQLDYVLVGRGEALTRDFATMTV